MSFSTLPQTATLSPSPTPFQISIPDKAIEELKTLLKLSRLAKETFENLQGEKGERSFGVGKEWVAEMKGIWEEGFEWRKHEAFINSFPQFVADIEGCKIHFVGLFSEKVDAVPILFAHGWPGSFLEFLPILDILRTEYDAKTLPYHVIVPSLPGFAFSSPPPLDRDFGLREAADLLDKLMVGLGFGSGYVAQGGDIGSGIARTLSVTSESCKAVHLNFVMMKKPPEGADMDALSKDEKAGIDRATQFRDFGMAYSIEHGTRPSTIGLVLSSSPIALLAWIGEKFLEWSDESPSVDSILEALSLYWFTDTFPSSIYIYRERFNKEKTKTGDPQAPEWHIKKPMGFSSFPKELCPVPESWAKTTGNLVFFRKHTVGGHFAAWEQPRALMHDVADFVAQVWKNE